MGTSVHQSTINSQAVAWRALPTRRGDEDVGMSRKTTAAKLARAELILKYIGKEGPMSKRELARFVEDVARQLGKETLLKSAGDIADTLHGQGMDSWSDLRSMNQADVLEAGVKKYDVRAMMEAVREITPAEEDDEEGDSVRDSGATTQLTAGAGESTESEGVAGADTRHEGEAGDKDAAVEHGSAAQEEDGAEHEGEAHDEEEEGSEAATDEASDRRQDKSVVRTQLTLRWF